MMDRGLGAKQSGDRWDGSPAGKWIRLANRYRVTAMVWLDRFRDSVRGRLRSEAELLFGVTLIVGVTCGLAAVAFHVAIRWMEHLLIESATDPGMGNWAIWTILSPTVGGLLAGVLVTRFVPGAKGSGIPQVKEAFAREGGRIRLRDAVGKFVVSTLQIGSGASLGREGPTVHICAGVAGASARVVGLSPRNTRRMIPVGVAAGVAAAFNAPIAAVTFTIEEIVGTLDPSVLSGAVVAAAVAAVIERALLGAHPMMEVIGRHELGHASSLVTYALLGLVAAMLSVSFTDFLLRLRRGFKQSDLPAWLRPAVGGLATGVLAVLILYFVHATGVAGGGYASLGAALSGRLAPTILGSLLIAKFVATALSYSSGGVGGIFAPSLFLGAMLGGFVGHMDRLIPGHESTDLAAFALVGMGAVFAGIIRAPMTSVLLVFELTGGYELVLPLMLANTISYALARRWRPVGIYEALMAQDGVRLPYRASVEHPLEKLRVVDALRSPQIVLRSDITVGEARAALMPAQAHGLAVVDDHGRPVGIVTAEACADRGIIDSTSIQSVLSPVASIGSSRPLIEALMRMEETGSRQLVVLDGDGSGGVLGVLGLGDLIREQARASGAKASSGVGASIAVDAAPVPIAMAPTRTVREVPAETSLDSLLSLAGDAAVAVVARGDGWGLIPPVIAGEMLSDADLHDFVLAADLARPADSVYGPLTVDQAMDRFAQSEYLIQVDESRRPIAALLKDDLARSLLDQQIVARRASIGSE